ncbi:dihydrodipicolinate synthase family protein [Gemmatimonadota bacterium]
MEPSLNLEGVIVPLVTPFSMNGNLDADGLIDQLTWLTGRGLTAVVALGSTGEAPFLDRGERREVINAAAENREEGTLLLAGIGVESTRLTIGLALDAAEAGADAVLVVNPSFYRSAMTPRVLLDHYTAVADASPLPVVLYTIPQNTGLALSHDLVEELSLHPDIIGLKESGGDLRDLQLHLQRTPPEFSIITGASAIVGYAAAAGADAAILAMANVVPELCVELFRAGREGALEEMKDMQARLSYLTRSIQGRFGIAGLKAAAELLGGTGGLTRAPLKPVTDEERSMIRAALVEGGVDIPAAGKLTG